MGSRGHFGGQEAKGSNSTKQEHWFGNSFLLVCGYTVQNLFEDILWKEKINCIPVDHGSPNYDLLRFFEDLKVIHYFNKHMGVHRRNNCSSNVTSINKYL